MRLIASSKTLANQLAKIDFEKDNVNSVSIEGNTLWIHAQNHSVELFVEKSNIFFKSPLQQTGRRWDWVKQLVSSVEEQPIVLEIHENVVNVIFQY